MKACPSCTFLMGDDQERCQHCAVEADRFAVLHPDSDSVEVGSAGRSADDGGGVAVMTPPKVAPLPQTVRYRGPRKQISVKMIVMLVLASTLVLAALGWTGSGPLANQFVHWGLVSASSEMFPADWGAVTDPSRSFSVEMPSGADYVFAAFDPAQPSAGLLVGEQVEPGTGASMRAVFTNFGLGAESLAAYDSPAGVRELATRFIGLQMEGEPTVVREAVVPEGYAVDTVVLSQGASARARFIFARDRFYALVTSGPDSDSKELDAAHQRMLASFDPNN